VSAEPAQAPSVRELTRSAIGAAVVGGIVLLVAVLPAEAGIDPTGIGTWLGLTAMGESRAPPAPTPAPVAPAAFEFRTDTVEVNLRPGEGTEVKAVMRAGDQLVYTWTADGGAVLYDFHGEPKGAAADVFTSYAKGTSPTEKGTFEAPFEGIHGWYWKNTGPSGVTVKLETTGVYASIGRK